MLPLTSPYSAKPLSEWIEDVRAAIAPEDRYRAVLAVSVLGTHTDRLQSCRQALDDTDSGVRALAAKQLGEFKRRDEEPAPDGTWQSIETDLVERLGDDDPDVRFEAARALGRINPKLTAPREFLIKLLDDEETQPLMLAVVVTALGERCDHDASSLVPRLRKLLGHSQAEVRENTSAVIAASQAISAGLVQELIAALDDNEPIVRENAARGLGAAGNSSTAVLAGLLTASTDEDAGVAQAACEAHQRLLNA